MALVANSDEAQNIGAAILQFQEHLPEVATEIAALVAECFAVSAALLELNAALRDQRNSRRVYLVDEDKYIVLRSLEYTFKDTQRKFGGLGRYRDDRDGFPVVWQELKSYFFKESGTSLLSRMEIYKRFLRDISLVVIGEHPSMEIEDLHDHIDDILEIQDERLADDLENMNLGTPRVRSWERVRPYGLGPQGQPNPNAAGGSKRTGSKKNKYQQPTAFDRHPYPPDTRYNGDTPSSPTTSVQSSSIASAALEHWLPAVFGQYRPTTVFTSTGSESACFGENAPGATARLKLEHEKLLTLPFETSGSLEVRIYLRPSDGRARLLCRQERSSSRTQSVIPVSSLRIHRVDSCLQLCRLDSRRRLLLWANLRFSSYERLVIFFCAFLALKSQDEAHAIRDLDDHILDDEIPVFKARIIDDSTPYALQLFKDANSGGIRLQASSLRPATRRAPVWTAFVNYQITTVKWIRQVEPRKVHLFDLNRYVFVNGYVPQQGPAGENELHFEKSSEAKLFIKAIEDLADNKI